MAIVRYLAMTPEEIAACAALPAQIGYMACHFSPYGTGLTGCPRRLPAGAMLILNDRIPLAGHNLRSITAVLRELAETLSLGSVLLDFERTGCREETGLAAMLDEALPCPVGVPPVYAARTAGPVFLPPVPCDCPLSDYLAPWGGREIWLEGAMNAQGILLTPQGASDVPPLPPDSAVPVHHSRELHCRYQIRCGKEVLFSLYRSPEDLLALEAQAEALGVTRMIGLWQELRGIWI